MHFDLSWQHVHDCVPTEKGCFIQMISELFSQTISEHGNLFTRTTLMEAKGNVVLFEGLFSKFKRNQDQFLNNPFIEAEWIYAV